MTNSPDARGGARLRGWKEIARHLRADERTVRRWETRGLPVHRVPGEGRSSVFADPAELDPGPVADDADPAPKARRRWREVVLVMAALAVLIPLAVWQKAGRLRLAAQA